MWIWIHIWRAYEIWIWRARFGSGERTRHGENPLEYSSG